MLQILPSLSFYLIFTQWQIFEVAKLNFCLIKSRLNVEMLTFVTKPERHKHAYHNPHFLSTKMSFLNYKAKSMFLVNTRLLFCTTQQVIDGCKDPVSGSMEEICFLWGTQNTLWQISSDINCATVTFENAKQILGPDVLRTHSKHQVAKCHKLCQNVINCAKMS